MQRVEVHIKGRLPFSRERVFRIVSAANGYSSTVMLEGEGLTINGKSMLGLLTLAPERGRRYYLVTRGEDEEEALHRICALLEDDSAV